jgi:hypothetical protein
MQDVHVTTVHPLALPQIGGELMSLRVLEEKVATLSSTLVPVGSVLPFTGTMEQAEAKAATGWIVCDGRVITDPESPLTGRNTPDLRGRVLLGGTQTMQLSGSTKASVPAREVVTYLTGAWASFNVHGYPHALVTGPQTFFTGPGFEGKGTVPEISVEIPLPPHMSVIYLMRVK